MHPSFVRAKNLPEPIRFHFPTTPAEARDWQPTMNYRALSSRVLAVAVTRIECAWAAYIDSVPGISHSAEIADVASHGTKLDERIARVLFPRFDDVPYAV